MDLGERRLTENVLPEDYLEINNGEVIKNVLELIESLNVMDDEIFGHYVSRSHNKISDWILEGYGRENISKKLEKVYSKKKMVDMLKNFVEMELKEGKKRILSKIVMPKNKKEVLMTLSKIDERVIK